MKFVSSILIISLSLPHQHLYQLYLILILFSIHPYLSDSPNVQKETVFSLINSSQNSPKLPAFLPLQFYSVHSGRLHILLWNILNQLFHWYFVN